MLCKCSGKYIDIYFILKITCYGGTNINVCFDRILTFGIRSIRLPAKVELVIIKLLAASLVVSWKGWESTTTPPPLPPQHNGSTVILCSTTVE